MRGIVLRNTLNHKFISPKALLILAHYFMNSSYLRASRTPRTVPAVDDAVIFPAFEKYLASVPD